VGKAIVAPKEIRTRYTEFEAEHIDSHTSNAEGGTCLRTFSAPAANMRITPCICQRLQVNTLCK